MGIIARQSIKGALANYLGVVIGFFTTFFVLTDCLSQEEIGLTRVLVDATMLFAGLAQLGTNASIIRFFPFFKSSDGRNHGIFGWSLLLPLVGFSLFALLFFLFKSSIIDIYSEKSPLIVNYIYYLLPMTFCALYMTVFETNASVLLRITVPKFVREVVIRLLSLVCYILYGKQIISLDLFVLLFCANYGIAMLLNFFYLLSLGNISFRVDFDFLNPSLLKDILRYTLFMTATVLAGNIPLINSLFLGAKAGLGLTGVYTIAFYIANIVEVPYRSLGAISAPMISQAVRDENWPEVNRLSKQVSLHQFLVSALLFFFIWINLRSLFEVIPHGSEYMGGMGVVLLLGLAKVINSSLSIGTNVLNYSTKFPFALLFIVLLTVASILLNQWLISLWSINGSAAATLLAYLIYFFCLLLFIWRSLRVNLFCFKHLVVLCLVGVLFASHFLWQQCLTPSVLSLFSGHHVALGYCCDSLFQSFLFALLTLFALRHLHISHSVDLLLRIPFLK